MAVAYFFSCFILISISWSYASAADFKFLTLRKQNFVEAKLSGDTVDFDCNTSDASANVTLWKRKEFGVGTNIIEGNRIKLNGQVFSIYNLTLIDGGSYYCKATDSNGQKIEENIGLLYISQGGRKYPIAYMESANKIVKAMSDVNFTCYSSGDGIRHTWSKDGKRLPQRQIKSYTNKTKSGFTLQRSVLHLRQVTPADDGNYVCQVNTSFTRGYQHNASAFLNVTVEALKWNRSAQLFTDFAAFYIDDPVEFDCSLTQPWVNVSLWFSEDSLYYVQIIPGNRIRKINQKFKIDKIRLDDTGDYECRAANIAPQDATYVDVSPDGIPRPTPAITYTKGSQVHRGSDVKLTCKATGDVNLEWFKIDVNETRTKLTSSSSLGRLASGRSETTCTLTITKFDESDDGTYRCVLTRLYVVWRHHDEVYLSVKTSRIPTFAIFPSNQSVVEGSHLTLEYDVNGSPLPSISWYKVYDGDKEQRIVHCNVGACKKDVSVPGLDVNRRYISLSGLSYPRDDIVLKCVAKNVAGSSNRTLRFALEGKPRIAKGKDEISSIYMYSDKPKVNVVCVVKFANPKVDLTYKWEIQQYLNCKPSECKPKDSNWELVVSSPNSYGINSNSWNSTLTLIQNKKNVFIRCTVSNKHGQSNHTWNIIILADSKLHALEKTVVTDEGTNVRLSCKAVVSTFDKIIWMRNNTVVSQKSRYSFSENTSSNGMIYSLDIRNANVTDGGAYQCIGVANGKRNSTDTMFVTVQEMKAPFVRLSIHECNHCNASLFTISCNIVRGHPRPTITWTKNGHDLPRLSPLTSRKACSSTVSGIYRMSKENHKDNAVLIICKADYEEDSGWFMCNASNTLGSHSDKTFVNITAAATIVSPKKRLYEVELGKPFLLPCVSKGNPKPRVWWIRKEEGKGFQRQENNLNFTSVKEENFGSYQCVAENMFGRKTFTITIALKVTTVLFSKAGLGSDNSKKLTVVVGCVSFAILAIVIAMAVILYKRKKAYGGFYILTLPPLPDYIKKLDPGTPLTEQTNRLPYDAQWEFPRNRLKFYRELGAGAFGKVLLAEGLGIVAFDPRGSVKRKSSRRRFGGSARRNHYVNNHKVAKVAVKTLKEDSGETEYKDLLSELKILIHVGEHKNIVNLLGACTKGRESDLWIIIEFCSNGNLLQFLRNRRVIYEPEWKGVSKDPNNQLTMTDLVIAAYQVARGMEFLASRMCIHRDLATRNILMTENYVIKIADFGLARDVGTDSQYVKTSTGLLPIKWMAIEAIIERLFTEKSDVWSFGIVLWELFTLGGNPYPKISPNEVAEYLAMGKRMDRPHLCPEEIGSLMESCWHDDRDNRPTFKELVQILDKIIEVNTSSEEGCGYLEVQGDEVKNDYLRPSEVKSPQMDPFECNSPLPTVPSPGDNESDNLLERDQNARHKKFNFDKSDNNRGRKDSELEKVRKDGKPENSDPESVKESDIDGYIDTSLTGKEKARIEYDLDKDRDSSEEPRILDGYAYWKKSIV